MGEAFISLTDVCQTRVIQKNLLEDKGSNLKHKLHNAQEILQYWRCHPALDCKREEEYRFGELTAGLHDAKAQRDDLCCQKEVDYFLLICFH